MTSKLAGNIVGLRGAASCIARPTYKPFSSTALSSGLAFPLPCYQGVHAARRPPCRALLSTSSRLHSSVAERGRRDAASPATSSRGQAARRSTDNPSLRSAPAATGSGGRSTVNFSPLSSTPTTPATATTTAIPSASPSFAPTSSSPVNAGSARDVVAPRDATLDWNTFFRLRKVRRWYHLVASFVTAMGTTVTGVVLFSQRDVDTAVARMFGLEPFLVLGIATVACGALGWLAGPSLGNSVFNLVYRRMKTQLALKEKGFYARIKRYRVDPSAQSFSNPVPDYYGEKIGSVAGYRQWLKDQRAYNKKRQSFGWK